MSQLAVNRLQNKAIPGMKSNIGIDHVVSRRAEGANLDIGIAVVQGTTFNDVILPADAGGQVFKGFSLQSHDRENLVVGVNNAVYKENSAVNVMVLGSAWMTYTGTPTLGTAVFVDITAGNEGKVTIITAANNFAATGWIFTQVDTITGLAEVSNIEI